MSNVIQAILLDLVAVVFLLSGGAKLFSLRSFREGLFYIPHVPIWATYLVGWALPFVEIILALGLFLNWTEAKVAALMLIAIFCAVVALVLWRRLQVPCGCFGALDDRYLSIGTVRDNALLAVAILFSFRLSERGDFVQTLPVAAFMLFLFLSARELLRQQRGLAALRKQGAL